MNKISRSLRDYSMFQDWYEANVFYEAQQDLGRATYPPRKFSYKQINGDILHYYQVETIYELGANGKIIHYSEISSGLTSEELEYEQL